MRGLKEGREEKQRMLGWLCGCRPCPRLELTEPLDARRISFFLSFFLEMHLCYHPTRCLTLLETLICGLSILLLTLMSLLHNHRRKSVAIWNVNELLAWPIAICSSV